MDSNRVHVGCAVGDPCLRGRVGEALAALGVGCVDVGGSPPASPLTAAIVVEAGSRGWSACVAALESGHPPVPHVVLVPEGRFSAVAELLKAPRGVRRAIHAPLEVDSALAARLAEVLFPLVDGAIRREDVAVIQAMLAGGDPMLEDFVAVVLEDPPRRTTVGRVIKLLETTEIAVRQAVERRGLAPPSRFLRAVRVLAAHALLADGVTVEAAARLMGYCSEDLLREHFRRSVGVTPAKARQLTMAELADRVGRAG
jgi:AraC-like DNA-binding protein